jgi:hypothetical protein
VCAFLLSRAIDLLQRLDVVDINFEELPGIIDNNIVPFSRKWCNTRVRKGCMCNLPAVDIMVFFITNLINKT